jgi:nicotinamide riboside transporter PnuC
MMWILTAVSLIGVVLNIQKKRSCFLLWAASNSAWAMIDFKKDIPAQGWLFVIYVALAVWGWFSWRKG